MAEEDDGGNTMDDAPLSALKLKARVKVGKLNGTGKALPVPVKIEERVYPA